MNALIQKIKHFSRSAFQAAHRQNRITIFLLPNNNQQPKLSQTASYVNCQSTKAFCKATIVSCVAMK
jgi:hypothetical protein